MYQGILYHYGIPDDGSLKASIELEERLMADLGGRVAECRFSIIIFGEGLIPEKITAALEMEPTKVVAQGAIINRLPEIRAEFPEWVHVTELTSPMGADSELNQLLDDLIVHKEQLHAISRKLTVKLCLHVTSDSAQMAYQLMPETLHRLTMLEMPLDVSSLSWGDVDM